MEPTPRRWWTGPLDTERLAWDAVSDAARAAQALADARDAGATFATTPALVAAAFDAIGHLRVDGREPQGWAPLSGFVEAADGWVRLHANYPHHAAAIGRSLGARTREELAAAVGRMPALAVEEAVARERGVAVAVRTPQEWAAHPHGAATAGDPWVEVVPGGPRPALRPGVEPLAGVRVLDLTRVIAGPTCSQLLACLGADVLRLDPPGRPELLDQHLSTGMGKRSAVVDLAREPAALEPLLPDADVVLLGCRPGSLARFGLGPEALTTRHPHLVVASLSAWGEHGPWAQRPGFDSIVQAACGIAATCGDETRPGALPVQALDHATGFVLAARVMDRLREGRGGIVRVSLLGAARTLLGHGAPPVGEPADLPVRTVGLDSPHGRLRAVPPPLTRDGAAIGRPVGEYGAGRLAWV